MTIPTELREPLAAAAARVSGAATLVTTGHIGPDGDALGSAVALAYCAGRAGKQAVAAFGGDQAPIGLFDFLPLEVVVPPAGAPAAPDLVVTFDVGELDRIGEVAGIAASAGAVVMIDHHLSTAGFGDVQINMPQAAAAAQLCFYLLRTLDWDIDERAATALLTGLVTDTGRFQYSNTTPEVLRVAAELVDAGARPELIGQRVYESVPFGYLGLSGDVLGRAVLEAEHQLIWSSMTQADLAKHGIQMADTDPLIDAVRVAREADVAVLLKERPDGGWKVSMRSRGRVDVAAIAGHFGGGGHHNASGFSFNGSPEAAIAAVRDLLP